MILVVGATGRLGGIIVDKLTKSKKSRDLRVLVRTREALAAFEKQGLEGAIGDLTDRESLITACRGCETIITTANSVRRSGDDTIESVDIQGTCNLIDAALGECACHFVYISAYGASLDHPAPLLAAKAYVEAYLKRKRLLHTVLAPNLFMESWVEAVVGEPARAGREVVLVGEGRRRHSMVSEHDVATIAACVASERTARDERISIGGPAAISWLDVIGAYERVLGRSLAWSRSSTVPGLPEALMSILLALETFDSPIDMGAVAARYDLKLTCIEDYAARTCGEKLSAS